MESRVMKKIIQKFHRGDIVKVLKGDTTDVGQEAVVVGSYWDLFRDWSTQEDKLQYTLRFKKVGEISWYDEANLELVRRRARRCCPTCGRAGMK